MERAGPEFLTSNPEDNALNPTPEQIEQLQPVYRHFLLALRPVVESRDSTLKVTGVPLGRIYSLLRMHGDPYEPEVIGQALNTAGLVQEDRLGFYSPTAKGVYVIRALIGTPAPLLAPPLPF